MITGSKANTHDAAEGNADARPTAMQVIAGHDLHGYNAVITGGATGIGYETARALASAGARVVIAARDTPETYEAMANLRRQSGGRTIIAEPIDLGSLASVRSFVKQFLSYGQRLHLLINNAGIMTPPLTYTADGFESQFATNYLGHFALTTGLLPALISAEGARVINLTSIAHRRSNIVFDDINYRRRPYNAWEAYGQSNTATALFGVALTERYGSQGITGNAVMPGGILTGLQKHIPPEKQMELGWIDESGKASPIMKTPEQGAATTIWGAVSPELEGKGGLYLQNCAVTKRWHSSDPMVGYMPYALDPVNARRLWDISEAMVNH